MSRLYLITPALRPGDAFADSWNFGPAEVDTRTVGELADALASRWGSGSAWTTDAADHPHEASYLKVDASKARQRLGWAPRLDLDTALDWVVEWHRTRQAGGDAEPC